MKVKRKSHSPLRKKARRGFRGYPVATIAFYGPDDTKATKVSVGIVMRQDAEPDVLERWFSETEEKSKGTGYFFCCDYRSSQYANRARQKGSFGETVW